MAADSCCRRPLRHTFSKVCAIAYLLCKYAKKLQRGYVSEFQPQTMAVGDTAGRILKSAVLSTEILRRPL